MHTPPALRGHLTSCWRCKLTAPTEESIEGRGWWVPDLTQSRGVQDKLLEEFCGCDAMYADTTYCDPKCASHA